MTMETRGMGDQLEQFKGRLTMMKLIHLALVAGVLIFGLVVLVIIHAKMSFVPTYQNPVVLVAVVLVAGNLAVASVLHKFFFKVSGPPTDAGAAVQKYQVFFLMRAALVEGAALFSAVVTLITCNILPMCLLAVCAGALVFYRPSQQEFVDLMRTAAEGGGGRRIGTDRCTMTDEIAIRFRPELRDQVHAHPEDGIRHSVRHRSVPRVGPDKDHGLFEAAGLGTSPIWTAGPEDGILSAFNTGRKGKE